MTRETFDTADQGFWVRPYMLVVSQVNFNEAPPREYSVDYSSLNTLVYLCAEETGPYFYLNLFAIPVGERGWF